MSILPGHVRITKQNEDESCCEDNCNNDATHAVASEVDSFGVEWLFLCEEHITPFRSNHKKPTIGICDWCHAEDVEIRPMRDFEEGDAGGVYDVCLKCRQRKNKQLSEEMDNMDD